MPTVGDLLNDFSEYINAAYSEREKQQIGKDFLMHYLKCDTAELILRKEEELPDDLVMQLDKAIDRINEGEPVQYVLGYAHFFGMDFLVDNRALIPRPETEELVQWVIDTVGDNEVSILDVGTGSGCIALALQSKLKKATITGVDVMQRALELAKTNGMRLDLPVKFEVGNAQNLTKFSKDTWDVIVSNPPYITQSEKSLMSDNVVKFEPHSALFVPDMNPLLFYKTISQYALAHLADDGYLFFEVNENYGKEVVELLKSLRFSTVELQQDLQGKDRMILARK